MRVGYSLWRCCGTLRGAPCKVAQWFPEHINGVKMDCSGCGSRLFKRVNIEAEEKGFEGSRSQRSDYKTKQSGEG